MQGQCLECTDPPVLPRFPMRGIIFPQLFHDSDQKVINQMSSRKSHSITFAHEHCKITASLHWSAKELCKTPTKPEQCQIQCTCTWLKASSLTCHKCKTELLYLVLHYFFYCTLVILSTQAAYSFYIMYVLHEIKHLQIAMLKPHSLI